MLWLALLILPSQARPTSGGAFGYDASDEVVSWDSPGGIRVHYSIAGPSQTLLDDEDADGVPDFVQSIAREVELSLDHFEETGFRRPLLEADVGLSPLGGSPAFDVYLVDFDGVGDGAYRNDACREGVCAGHLLIENDFVGYGYANLEEAASTLASHELFHAVQAAYTEELPVWVSEGTAVWAQRHYDPDSNDFVRFANAYLSDSGRSLDRPPAGPTPSFAYGTGLWFDFLSLRHGDAFLVDFMEVMGTGGDPIARTGELLEARGDSWDDAFTTFATWNLSSLSRSGGLSDGGYPYARRLNGLRFEAVTGSWREDARVFPLGALYFAVDHPGGPMWAGSAECDETDGLPVVLVHAAESGVVQDPLDVVSGAGRLLAEGQDLPAGRYFMALTVPRPADASSTDLVCVDAAAELSEACLCATDSDEVDTDTPDEAGGCACSSGNWGVSASWLLLAGLGLCRRRRPSQAI